MRPSNSNPYLKIIHTGLAANQASTWRLAKDPAGVWLYLNRHLQSLPGQGWKLHVSADVISAPNVLSLILPILLTHNSCFKTAASQRVLAQLNSGQLGHTQIGKFITVYPTGEAEAVRLALLLHKATYGLDGPAIPSDRPLRDGGIVYYRYGSFGTQSAMVSINESYPAMVRPDGEVVPDRPKMTYQPQQWIDDPFIRAGVAAEIDPRHKLLDGRYLIVGALHKSERGSVELAVDVLGARKCILKRARRKAHADLIRESKALAALAGAGAPVQYAIFQHCFDHVLIVEYIEGQSLRSYVAERLIRGEMLALREVLRLSRLILDCIEAIYRRGFVYSDLKPDNVIVDPEAGLRFIDFEHVFEIDVKEIKFPGTVGYASPQQRACSTPNIQDTIYAFGALVLFMLTGADPGAAPDPEFPLARPISLLRPDASPGWGRLVAQCLERKRAKRFRSLQDIRVELSCISKEVHATTADTDGEFDSLSVCCQSRAIPRMLASPDRYRVLAQQTILDLCSRANTSSLPQWRGSFPETIEEGVGGLAGPLAGPIIALAEACLEYATPELFDTISRAVEPLLELDKKPWRDGLYAGNVGSAAALLRAGLVLRVEEWVHIAEKVGLFVAKRQPESPDLVEGLAGHIRFLLFLSDSVGNSAGHLNAACRAGDALVKVAEKIDGGCLRWWTPTFQGKRAYFGYAHGAAGIGDVLLDLFDATGKKCYLEAARATARWLESKAKPLVFSQRAGIDWPATESDLEMAPAWCHGASGIGRFFLHLSRFNGGSGAFEIAQRAARTTASARSMFRATQCHGLAGSIEFLLDMYQACGDSAYLNEASILAQVLECFALRHGKRVTWRGDVSRKATDDFLTGQSGTALCLVRLADPGHRPHVLSRRGFLFGVGPLPKNSSGV